MEKVQESNPTTAINVLYDSKMNIYPANISKCNLNHEKQIILLKFSKGEGCHYLAAKKLSSVLRGITSKHVDDLHCLIVSIRLEQKTNFNIIKRVCENKDLRGAVMPSKDTKTL